MYVIDLKFPRQPAILPTVVVHVIRVCCEMDTGILR